LHTGSWAHGFADRREAGVLLAQAIEQSEALADAPPAVIVGLARGGVEVAAEVAAALGAPLDALAVRKVGHPWQPEYGIGAVAPGGVHYLRSHDGLSDDEVADAMRAADERAAALDARLHERRAQLPVTGATCVLVDDGLATGGTMVAAARWARAAGARRVIVAVPVGAEATIHALESAPGVDAVVYLGAPRDFGAVGFWYRDFRQVPDEQVTALLDEAHERTLVRREAEIPVDGVRLDADLTTPALPSGWVVFAHGSGSSRRSPRNVLVATELNRAGIGTLLFDLLTTDEEIDRRNVFDVELLAERLVAATSWLEEQPATQGLPVGYFGASTGAAAALLAAAELGGRIAAVVSRGGRPDLAGERLGAVRAPTLLVVGGADDVVLDLNRAAATRLTCPYELAVVPGATHLFEEPGALEHVVELARDWFAKAFSPPPGGATTGSDESYPTPAASSSARSTS
jgi:putative phosphoribosyl transferase